MNWTLTLVALVVLGCSEPVDCPCLEDAGMQDGGASDGGDFDAGHDGALEDGGALDGGTQDGGTQDGGGGTLPAVPVQACGISCGAHAVCDPATHSCVCEPTYRQLAGCVAYPVSDTPPLHTAAEVCEIWRIAQIHEVPAGEAGWENSEIPVECDEGRLKEAEIRDALRRANGHRAMIGATPLMAADETGQWEAAQKRALAIAVVGENRPNDDYSPATCYANEPYSSVIGHWQQYYAGDVLHGADAITSNLLHADFTAGEYQVNGTVFVDPNSERLTYGFTFGGICGGASGAPDVSPDWFAFPTQGAYPIDLFGDWWAFFAEHSSIDGPAVQVTRVGDGQLMPVQNITPLRAAGDYDGVAFQPDGWTPAVGESYEVAIADLEPSSSAGTLSGTLRYTVTPVDCGS